MDKFWISRISGQKPCNLVALYICSLSYVKNQDSITLPNYQLIKNKNTKFLGYRLLIDSTNKFYYCRIFKRF